MLCACPCRVHRPLLQPHPQSPAPPPPARSGTSIAPTPPAITQPLPVARHDSPAGRAVSVRAGSRLIAGPFFASSSAQARPASPVFRCRYGTACTRRRCAAPAPPLRRSRVVTAPLLRRRRAAPALPLCLPTDKGAMGLRVWVSSCRETARQRQKAETQGAARRNAERTCTQRDRPGRERVDISLLPVHVEEASSHVEPACPQGAAGSC